MKDIKEIKVALKKAGIKKSEVTEYVVRDYSGVSGRYAPRTKSLKRELEILFGAEETAFIVDKVWVNGLNQVIIEMHYDCQL